MNTQGSTWSELLSGRNAARSVALSGGVALHAINIYIATTILPSVVTDIGGLNLYAWNTTLFVVASILGSALTARLLQRAGPRGAYGVAGGLFLLGSLACSLAPNMPLMLVGRSVQGLGGGLLFALSYSMIQRVFDERLWPRAMALISGMWGIACLIGPAIGGIFAELHAWRAAFGSLIPITLAYLLLTFSVLPKAQAQRPPAGRLPVTQLLLLVAAVLAISLGSLSLEPLWNLAGIALACVLMAWLVAKESRSATRLLPKGALHPRSPLFALYGTMALLIIGMTGEIFVPYFLQLLHGQTPLLAGYLAALMAVGWTCAELLSAGWLGAGVRRAIVGGPVCALAGLVLLALFSPVAGRGDWAVLGPVCLGLTLIGFGIGLGWPHLLTRVLQVAPPQEQEAAASSITTVQLFATALGAALAGMIANQAGLNTPGGVEGAAHAARWLFAVLSVAPLLAIGLALRSAAIRF